VRDIDFAQDRSAALIFARSRGESVDAGPGSGCVTPCSRMQEPSFWAAFAASLPPGAVGAPAEPPDELGDPDGDGAADEGEVVFVSPSDPPHPLSVSDNARTAMTPRFTRIRRSSRQ
jgi:hypothetical protein